MHRSQFGADLLLIIHSGQTGVERGAHQGAVSAGLTVAGFMPLDRRDELGRIPIDVAENLTACSARGPRQAVRANVQTASGVLIVVPSASTPNRFTAMASVLQAIRSAGATSFIADGETNLDDVARWAADLAQTSSSTRIVVTGPRATRWTTGEAVARRLVTAIAMLR